VRIYLTTPIYYVNATPHIGHAYTTIAADILARHHRQRGHETFFLTGTDEHGTNIPRVAAEAGLDVKEFVDRNAAAFRQMTERVNASNDFFIRTTDPRHEVAVQEFVQRIYDAGAIYEDVYAGLYCPRCEAFYTEAELIDGKCPVHGIVPEYVEEKNWFFRLSAYQDRLLELYDRNPEFVLPRFRYNEARSFIEQGLEDISVSRASERWGVPVPWNPGQTVYVWVDALINYWSALAFAREGEDLRPVFWPEVRHLLGKDILKFHCVIWPAFLLAAGLEVPKQLFVHGYLLFGEQKMSKSLGNVIDPLDLIDVYGADPVRFYVVREVQFGQDGNVSIDGVHDRYERELGNDLGNLVSRTT
jgi:methionyl-tRNA synthetase